MMRYTLSSVQLFSFYLVVTLTSTCLECKHSCDDIFSHKAKLLFEGELHEYSHYYYYSQSIRVNRSPPIVINTFEKFSTSKDFYSKFPLKFYGYNVSRIRINTKGEIIIYGSAPLGIINHKVPGIDSSEYEVFDGDNLFAYRRSLQKPQKNSILTFKITTLLHSNGKISFYYDNIPRENGEKLLSEIHSSIRCEKKVGNIFHVRVDAKWIKSGTLVEYEVSNECRKRNSNKSCQDSALSDTTCFWCEKANMCTTSSDEDIHDFKENGCRIKNSSNGNVLITPIVVELATATPSTSESDLRNESEKTTQTPESRLNSSNGIVLITPTVVEQATTSTTISESDLRNESEKTTQTPESRLPFRNMTIEVIKDNEQKKSLHLMYIILILFIIFLVVCCGCAIYLWLYRREK